ncbi:hypothetical protein [Candidatus Accumulibacter contiguus]|uniref:hypothetical protein n=1 Tax=Candidatus Accumulibacter contiguus TaxID=2954381 RepID=UPI002FC2B093
MHRFRTRTELDRPSSIAIVSDDRSFCRFDVRWAFAPLATITATSTSRSTARPARLFLRPVVEMLILPMAASMVTAFEARAHALAAKAGSAPAATAGNTSQQASGSVDGRSIP